MLLPEDADELVAHMPNARWVEVENAGHTVQGDNPAGLLRELDAFLPA
jgi:pimeloyl-ACP methyl ester carboxylesterase